MKTKDGRMDEYSILKKRIEDLLKAGEENGEEYSGLYQKSNYEPNKIQENKKNDVGANGVNSNSRRKYIARGDNVFPSSVATQSQRKDVSESSSENNGDSQEGGVLSIKREPEQILGAGKKVYEEKKN